MKRIVVRVAVAAVTATAVAALTVAPANAAGTWAAIAFSPSVGSTGWGYDAGTKGEAEDIALGYCHDYGGTDCQIAASAAVGCLALADSPTHWAGGLGPTQAAAETDALNENGGGHILVSGCTGA